MENAKITLNRRDNDVAPINLNFIKHGLSTKLESKDLSTSLNGYATSIGDTTHETIRIANLTPEKINTITFVGGSPLMSAGQA